jgi:hypothetical protein
MLVSKTGIAKSFIILFLLMSVGCAGPGKTVENKVEQPVLAGFEEQMGIEIVALRMTAAGHMLDLRYRVTNPEKAAVVFDRQNKAYLVDQASGLALPVPRTAKVGPLRQTNFEPDPRRQYFIMFNNGGGVVKPGSLVTLVVGDLRFENIMVE